MERGTVSRQTEVDLTGHCENDYVCNETDVYKLVYLANAAIRHSNGRPRG